MTDRRLTRREFQAEAVLALLAGVSITVTACGGSGSPAAPTPEEGDEVGAISANHGHVAILRAAQLQAGGAATITLSTGDGHMHSLALAAGDVVQIAGGARVAKETSSNDGHTHVVTFN